MGEHGHPAVMIQFSHKGPQIGNVAGHLPCPIGMTLRPRAASRGVLDAVRMRRQVSLDRLNADNVRFHPEIEDLGGKRMGNGDDGDIWLFAQIEPQSQGTMCREVSNKDVRQRTVVIFLVGGVLTRRAVCVLHSAVHTLDINVGRRRFVGRMFGLRLGLFVLGPDEVAFDPQ